MFQLYLSFHNLQRHFFRKLTGRILTCQEAWDRVLFVVCKEVGKHSFRLPLVTAFGNFKNSTGSAANAVDKCIMLLLLVSFFFVLVGLTGYLFSSLF